MRFGARFVAKEQMVEEGVIVEVSEHERKGAVECLWEIFGGTSAHLLDDVNWNSPRNEYKTLLAREGLIYNKPEKIDEPCSTNNPPQESETTTTSQ